MVTGCCLFRFKARFLRYLCVTIDVLTQGPRWLPEPYERIYLFVILNSVCGNFELSRMSLVERLSDKIPVEKENLALGAFFLHISKHVFILRRCQGEHGKEMNQMVKFFSVIKLLFLSVSLPLLKLFIFLCEGEGIYLNRHILLLVC